MKFQLTTRKTPLARQYLICIGMVLAMSVACFYTSDLIGYRVVALLLLVTVSALAMLFEILPVLAAAVLSAIIWNFFFIPPLYTFHISTAEDVLMFLLYFVIALVNAVLTSKIREAESRARDREEKANTLKLYDTLLHSLSHELRTPIAAILGAVDTLKENKTRLTDDQQAQLLSTIDAASIRLNRQVENLLNMSRLESGMLRLHTDWCDLNELVHKVIHKLSPPDHRIAFSTNDALPLFKLDAGIMEQVVYNLLHNALQYTPPQSVIDVTVNHQVDSCVLVVADHGPGIPQGDAERVFQKFYRMPNAGAGGSGLGLSIVKGFVEVHQGSVILEPNPGGGSRFTVSIPAETSYLNRLKNE